ncbi:MAG: response regulator transcription factor [Thermoleophilia bacterium]|nr:response regulator transcription factor [Thermoleophilia bacterium]
MSFRIALCDDNHAFRRLMQLLLEKEPDVEVVGDAADGAGAIELVRKHRPDVLLLDVAMPIMDGIEALPHVRAASPETRVIMLSGFSSAAIRSQAAAAGADMFVEKGADLQEIIAAIRSVGGAT